jgi:HSP20 family protein
MDIVKWNPFREMEDIMNRYQRLMRHTLPQLGFESETDLEKADWHPRVDIIETEKAYIVKAELPEVEKKDIDISVNQGLLTIRGERKREKEEKSKRFHRIERSYGNFSRSFRFPNEIEEDKIEADFKDGVLQITLPKSAKAAKQKQISINIK